ncbi:MAG: hypothetical protein WC867_06900 [Candidatus Pacearchaeota archaeon]|jgi:uncharacterized BrkB/YihY/UPF0761 family membrane protein
MKKKRSLNKNHNTKEINFNSTLYALKISSLVLLFSVFLLIITLFNLGFSLDQILRTLFRKPSGNDFLAIFAGSILFIVVPFVLGVKANNKF